MKAKLVQRSPARVAAASLRSPQVGPRAARPGVPSLHAVAGGLDAGTILRLQATAGNAAVSALLAQRAVESPPPPAPLVTVSPGEFNGFQTVAGRVGQETRTLKAHPSARSKVAEADRAAAGPTNEVRSQGAAAQVEQMGRQKPGTFDKAAFVTAVKAAIDKATPKSMEEVDDFSSSGKAGQMKEQVVGEVGKGKDAAAGGIKAASDAAPDTSHASPKPVTPMGPETPGASPADVNAGQAMPAPKPEDQVGLGYTKPTTDSQLEDAHVTQDQVDRSNEPQFQEAMTAKQEADQHAETAPQQFRQDEQAKLDQSKSQAGASAQTGLSGMHQVRSSAVASVGTHKEKEKGKNEAARAKVSADVEAIYTATKKDVDDILSGLDTKVGDAFNSGEGDARQAFESLYKTKKDAYFNDRYSGVLGGARWLKDKLISPPAEVNGFIDEAKQLYQSKMGQVIEQIATIVETELTRATQRIAEGRQKINDYVASQPKELRAAAQQAASEISSRFDELEQAVSDKSSALVDDLAQKYVAAAQAVDERCNAMREENKGLLEKAVDKVKGMIDTILKIKDMLVALAAKAASVVDQILSDPIGFLGNLVGAVKQGFEQFVSNIGKHLEEGLMGWLLGELADAGITMPETFDLKGILNLVLQVLGLTWQNIRARAVGILGEEVVGMIEQGVGAFQKIVHIFEVLREQGLAGLWEMISDKIGDLKAQVIDQIEDFVESKVITAGVTWILSLLNPASAFIKACKAIYDIIMFFVDRGSQIMSLVNTILDNLGAIVSGNIGAAANLVESVLAKGLPLAISFLASLLGVGGISEKIKEVIQAVQAPINKAIDWLLKTVVKPVASAAARAVGWVKGKAKAGVDWAKAKGKAGVDWMKAKAKGGVDKLKSKLTSSKSRAPVAADSASVKAAALRDVDGRAHDLESIEDFRALLNDVQKDHRSQGLQSLSARVVDDESMRIDVIAVASPEEQRFLPWQKVFKRADWKKLRGKFEVQEMTSFASVTVERRLIGSASSGGGTHAEKRLLGDKWIDAMKVARARGAKGRDSTVTLTINRAPCPECTELLVKAIGDARNDDTIKAHVHFRLAPTGVYEPTVNLTEDQIAQDEAKYERLAEKWGTPSYEVQSRSKYNAKDLTQPKHLAALVGAGWDLYALQARDEPTGSGEVLAEMAAKMLKPELFARFNRLNSQATG